MSIIRIELFGYELILRKSYFKSFHYTDYISNSDYSDKPYDLKLSIDKRIRALASHHTYIEWTFSSFNEAIQAYGIDAIETLNSVIESLVHIRNNLKFDGAKEEQLKQYDDKVCECFNLLINMIKNRIKSDNNNYRQEDIKLLNTIKDYDINNYHITHDNKNNNIENIKDNEIKIIETIK